MPPDPPRKPFSQSKLPALETRSSVMPEGDREMILARLAEVDQRWSERFDGFAGETNQRLTALEKNALLERETALAVRELKTSVDTLNAANRAQDMDIGALSHKVELATRPAVQATASAAGSAEGTLAGADAGKRAGKFWGFVLALVGVVVSQVLSHCEQQLANYQNGTAPAASSAPR